VTLLSQVSDILIKIHVKMFETSSTVTYGATVDSGTNLNKRWIPLTQTFV